MLKTKWESVIFTAYKFFDPQGPPLCCRFPLIALIAQSHALIRR